MNYNPLPEVIDEAILVSPQTLQKLQMLRGEIKFNDLPGTNITDEQVRLAGLFNELLDCLIVGVSSNPSKLWVMSQFQPTLETVQMEDTEGREHFGTYLEEVMGILNIESSDGLLGSYL